MSSREIINYQLGITSQQDAIILGLNGSLHHRSSVFQQISLPKIANDTENPASLTFGNQGSDDIKTHTQTAICALVAVHLDLQGVTAATIGEDQDHMFPIIGWSNELGRQMIVDYIIRQHNNPTLRYTPYLHKKGAASHHTLRFMIE